jgi:hypothetical protein
MAAVGPFRLKPYPSVRELQAILKEKFPLNWELEDPAWEERCRNLQNLSTRLNTENSS